MCAPSTPLSRSSYSALLCAGVASLVFLFASCDPPGKPKPAEEIATNITDFKTLFNENCAGCHGENGRNGPGRILNDPLYLAVLPKDTLRQILIHGRPGTAMPAWAKSEGGPLEPKQIEALVNGIEGWAKPVNLHGATLPPYSADVQTGNPDSGRKLFARNCFMCHGPGAKVGPVTDPSYLSLVSNQMIRTSIIVGRPDLGMPDYRNLKLGRPLADQDITDLVAFLASRRPAGITDSMENAGRGGQQAGPTGSHVVENGSGQGGATSRGNEGTGNGPGSPRQERGEGNKSTGSSSQRGIK